MVSARILTGTTETEQETESHGAREGELVGEIETERWVLADDLLWEGVQLNGPPPQQTEKSRLYGGARSVLLFYRRPEWLDAHRHRLAPVS